MSTTVSFFGGSPDGFGILGFFLVSVPTPSAISVTAAVGFANVGAFAVVSVVAVAVAVVPVSEPSGMSAVLPPPHAASAMQAAPTAGHFEWLMSRITAGTLLGQPKAAAGRRRIAADRDEYPRGHTSALEGAPRS